MHIVTTGSCAGGSEKNGGYRYSYNGKGDIPAGTLDITTLNKINPIVRMFDFNIKLAAPDYDYTVYICGTHVEGTSPIVYVEGTSPIATYGKAFVKFLMFSIHYFEIRFAKMVRV